MGRVLKPSVKAISASQTCCFPTEPTCQCRDLQLHEKRTHRHTHSHTHTQTHTHVQTPLHTQTSKRLYWYWRCIQVYSCRSVPGWKNKTKQTLAQIHVRKQGRILFTHLRARAHTRLARRFTLVWKDKHQPINKSVSLETCWPPPLSVCHTRSSRGQGQAGMSGRSEGG